jgi:hypothetical protein
VCVSCLDKCLILTASVRLDLILKSKMMKCQNGLKIIKYIHMDILMEDGIKRETTKVVFV